MSEIKIDKKAWERGYRDAYAKLPYRGDPEGLDALSYSSGRVEGEGDRLTGKPDRLKKAQERDIGR